MKIKCNITIEYDDESKAKKILQSTKVDNLDFVTSKTTNKGINSKIEAKSIPSLIHTLDDYLACLSVAEKIVDKN